MKLRILVAATSAALFSLGAIAGGDKQNQSQSQGQDKSAQTQSQSSQPSSSTAASGATSSQSASTSGQQTQKQAGASQSSDIVKQAQKKLSQSGHQVQADGVMGPKTQAALKEFQQSKGIEASGQLNKDTLAALGVNGEVTTGSAATGGSSQGQSSSGQAPKAASGSTTGQQAPAAKSSGQSSSGGQSKY